VRGQIPVGFGIATGCLGHLVLHVSPVQRHRSELGTAPSQA
jgi:hypothetical protein